MAQIVCDALQLVNESSVCKAGVIQAINIVRFSGTIFVIQRSSPTNHVTHT